MTTRTVDFTTTLLVDQTPQQAFKAITNVRGWWSAAIEGATDKLDAEFIYHYQDLHYCKLKLIELVPGQKVAWLVLDNYFKFTKDTSEWKGTRLVFDISKKGAQTAIRFTHEGLVPQYECYDVCEEAWTNYITNSLRNLIATGKGQPNPKENDGFDARLFQDYTVSITVNATAQEAFKSINNVTKWWTENLEGSSQQLDDEFTVRFGDVHVSTQKLVEVIPDKKVVWLVTDSRINFVENKHEWTNTKIVFEISRRDNQTRITFTHLGLTPRFQCYGGCSGAWGEYIEESLYKLITKGKGMPEPYQVSSSEITPSL